MYRRMFQNERAIVVQSTNEYRDESETQNTGRRELIDYFHATLFRVYCFNIFCINIPCISPLKIEKGISYSLSHITAHISKFAFHDPISESQVEIEGFRCSVKEKNLLLM